MKKRLLGLLLFLLPVGLFAQSWMDADSLKQVLKEVEETKRSYILRVISQSYSEDSFALALSFADRALIQSSKMKDTLEMAKSHMLLGDLWFYFAEGDDKRESVSSYFNAFELFASQQEVMFMAITKQRLGDSYFHFWDLEHALNSFIHAEGFFDVAQDSLRQIDVCTSIGQIYLYKQEWLSAEDYFRRALIMSQLLKNDDLTAKLLHRLSSSLIRQRNFDLAKHYLLQTRALLDSDSSDLYLAVSTDLAYLYTQFNIEDSASVFLQRSWELSHLPGREKSLAYTYYCMAEYEYSFASHAKAIAYLDSSLLLSKKYRIYQNILDSYDSYAKVYFDAGEYNLAISYKDQFYHLKDSLHTAELERKLELLRLAYEDEKRDADYKRMQADYKNQELKIDNEKYKKLLAWAMAFLLMIVSGFLFWRYKLKQRTNLNLEHIVDERTRQLDMANKELQILNNELDTFAYRTAHDIRGPVARLLGLCQVAEKADRQEIPDYLHLIHREAINMDIMLHRFLEINKIKFTQLNLEEIDLNYFITEMLSNLSDVEGFENIHFSLNIDTFARLNSDKVLLEIVLKNIIENSILFQNTRIQNPEVQIEIFQYGADTLIIVRDNGIGIPIKYSNKIFEMFYRATPQSKGLGLGLFAAFKAIKRLKGAIKHNKARKDLTEFHIFLPHSAVFTEEVSGSSPN